MEYLWIVWIVLGIGLAIAEIFTLGFVLLWFGMGALLAGGTALLGFGFGVQASVFLIVSMALTIASRTIFDNVLPRSRASQKMGIASLPGQIGTVVESSKGALNKGAVKVFGSTWTAYPVDGEEPLADGESVVVDRVDGAVIYVRRARPEGSWRS
jgi:membrane protein implicated in regulation of membrane protease activity